MRHPHPPGWKQTRGFTLIEVLVSLGLGAMAVLTFGTVFPGASRMVQRSRHTDLAINACQSQLEYYREAGYGSLPLVREGSATVAFTPPSDLPSAAGSVRFTYLNGSFNPSAAQTGRVRIEATVTWKSQWEAQRQVALTSLILE